MKVIDWGRMDYATALDKQKEIFNKKLKDKSTDTPSDDYLIFVEHDPVYTLGKNTDKSNILDLAKRSGATFHQINRGGDVTYHGPGQVVVYPIFDLKNYNIGLAKYVSNIEQVGIEVCAHYGLKAGIIEGKNGVWVDYDKPTARKVMAIGIKASRHITMHGLAFNVSTDTKYFDYIVPCGIKDMGVTTLSKELGKDICMDEVKGVFEAKFEEVFL